MNLKSQIPNLKNGFTLIEVVVYVGALGILVLALSNLTLSTIKGYRLAKIRENLATSADIVTGTFLRESRNAFKIYTPTSIFNSDSGELSLITGFQTTNKTEPITYVDIYLAGGRVWLKRENEQPQALTGDDLEVIQFKLLSAEESLFEGVRMYLAMRDKKRTSEQISLTTFGMLKGGYIE